MAQGSSYISFTYKQEIHRQWEEYRPSLVQQGNGQSHETLVEEVGKCSRGPHLNQTGAPFLRNVTTAVTEETQTGESTRRIQGKTQHIGELCSSN